mgnify:CR=1 FL=1
MTQQDILVKHLKPFRRRVRWILAWRYAAVGGTVGTALAFLTDLGDWLGKWEADPIVLVLTIVLGLVAGAAYAFFRHLPSEAIAQLIDRRTELKDRVTTALLCSETPFLEPLCEDALTQLASVRPSKIFRFRLTAWHGTAAVLLLALLVSRFLPQLPLPFLTSFRQDRKEAKEVVENLQRVLKPIVEHAKEPEATKFEKAMAEQIRELYKRSQKGRLSKKEALLKAEKLLAEVEKIQRQSQERIKKVSTKAITAAETLKETMKQKAMASQMQEMGALLNRMQEIERQLRSQNLTPTQRQLLETEKQLLQRTLIAMGQLDQQEIQKLMEALKQQQAQLQKMFQSMFQWGQLTPGEQQLPQQLLQRIQQLMRTLQSIQQQIRTLQLSKQAQEFLQKLMNDPNLREAMRILAKLQKQLQQLQKIQILQLSPEELEQMLKELEKLIEELAKHFGDDEKIRELAKQILEDVKRIKRLKECGT